MSKFLNVLLKYGKISQEQYDSKIAKNAVKEQAKASYKDKGNKLTKTELMAIIDELVKE